MLLLATHTGPIICTPYLLKLWIFSFLSRANMIRKGLHFHYFLELSVTHVIVNDENQKKKNVVPNFWNSIFWIISDLCEGSWTSLSMIDADVEKKLHLVCFLQKSTGHLIFFCEFSGFLCHGIISIVCAILWKNCGIFASAQITTGHDFYPY